MQLFLKNQTASKATYLNGIITVPENGVVAIPRDYTVLITQDMNFVSDVTSEAIKINDGSTDYGGSSGLNLIKFLAGFMFQTVATLPLYYSLPVRIRQTAATPSGSVVWSMRNDLSSVKNIVIERIHLTMSFDSGTPLVRTLLGYDLARFNGAAPTGGTALTVVLNDDLSVASKITDARFLDTGLTTAGAVFEAPFATVTCPAVAGSTTEYVRNGMCFKLAPGDGLSMLLNGAAVVGQGLGGEIVWSER